MSYFVLKGPCGHGQYLCTLPGYNCPQWWATRKEAMRFPDKLSAWEWLAEAQKQRDDGGAYIARVVRVNTVRDWKAEREQLRAERDHWRNVAESWKRDAEMLRSSTATTQREDK